ncbi:MAG: metal ABC transporter ATP-binding protein [Thermoplasmata archaeon]|nr:metal ABC transporter ATP-binding protein [Thermoplasmata archaeon]
MNAENTNTAPVLEARDLDIVRSGDVAIRGANFSIEKGDYVGIVGPNGGGKSSLLLAALGIIPYLKGTIRLFGQPIEEFKDWDRVAYVSQHAIDFDNNFPLTVRELVALGRIGKKNIGRRLGKKDWEHVDVAMSLMKITHLADKRVGHLSGGQKQRVFVAKALVRHPELLILDEPAAGVDPDAQLRFFGLLSSINKNRGTSILLVSHDLSTVFCQMSKVMCVNRDVHFSSITPDMDPQGLLKEVYGEHFTFVFHEHECHMPETGGVDHV